MPKLGERKTNLTLILLAFCIILVSFLVKILPIRGNNFFFTVDQGNDAVYIREILENKKLLLLGPETSIRGVFAGPLWYYFLAIGYLLSDGHPYGGVLILIILNLVTSLFLIIWLSERIGKIRSR